MYSICLQKLYVGDFNYSCFTGGKFIDEVAICSITLWCVSMCIIPQLYYYSVMAFW